MNYIQCKMARVGLGWRAKDLAEKADVGTATLARFELGKDISDESLQKITTTLKAQGVQFTASRLRVGVSVKA
ncbi:hypothetical protein A8B75_11605 [Sphingomonadales bacterium EhC05]|nr:hypothetical protein A8B75_11605 [Sphingomonadales bacterium EhC05]